MVTMTSPVCCSLAWWIGQCAPLCVASLVWGKESNMKYVATIATFVLVSLPMVAQSDQGQSSGSAFSPAKSIGMFAYPKNKQSADQQLKDEGECA